MPELRIEKYEESFSDKWDKFIAAESINGTFLQTRKFLNYHPKDRFKDDSLIIFKGNEIAGVIPACEVNAEGEKLYYSHQGSTFGGLILSDKVISCSMMEQMLEKFEEYLKENGYDRALLKQTSAVYSKRHESLPEYFLYKNGWNRYDELNFFMDLERYAADITAPFSSGKRRDYRYSLNNGLVFKELTTEQEIRDFHRVLNLNLRKLNLPCVHTCEDLIDLKFNRFPENILFFGVYSKDIMIAGSMIFIFAGGVFHTQYLSSDEEYLKVYPMDYLITNLISEAVKRNMKKFTFGISTEDHGKYLNMGLARFKEGFGAGYTINVSFEKKIG